LSREEDLTKGILSTHLHSEGQHAEELALLAPGMGARWVILCRQQSDDDSYFPHMNGQFVFKKCCSAFC
jgi:3-oxoacyl-[acyl-carrier-protein] synthase-3